MVEIEPNFQEKHKVRNGSFRVSVPIIRKVDESIASCGSCFFPKEVEQVDTNNYVVQMLTQNDYADRWRQVVPRARRYTKKFVDTEGNEQVKVFSNAYRMKVNLAQLPEYLWHRMQYVNDTTKLVRNGIHHYIIEKSNVDDEIHELANLLRLPVEKQHKERVMELLNILKDNDIYGWLVIRAKNMYR